MKKQLNAQDLERLKAMLEEDTGSSEDADALLPMMQTLKNLPQPEVDAQTVNRVIDALLPEMPRPESRLGRRRDALNHSWAWLVLRAQFRVVRAEIWYATALIMLVGTLIMIVRSDGQLGNESTITLFAPIVSAFGVAFIYGPETDPPLELMLATPVPARAILLARLTIVFGFNLLIGLMSSLLLVVTQSDLSLWPLVMAWLAPMTFLSALAFLISILTKRPTLGGVISFLIWFWQNIDAPKWTLMDMTTRSAQPLLLALALGLGLFALWLAEDDEHWMEHIS